MLNKDEVREAFLLLAKRNESLEVGISGIHVSVTEMEIPRAEMSQRHSPAVPAQRSVLFGEASPSLGLFPGFCSSEGFAMTCLAVTHPHVIMTGK